MANRFTVQINSRNYTLITDKSQEEVEKIASYVNEKLDNVEESNSRLNYERKSILAMVNIADDLFESKNQYEILLDDTKESVKEYPLLKTRYDKLIKTHNDLLNREVEHISLIKKNEEKIKELEESLEKSNRDKEAIRKNLKKQQDENTSLAKKLQETEKKIKR